MFQYGLIKYEKALESAMKQTLKYSYFAGGAMIFLLEWQTIISKFNVINNTQNQMKILK